jgi:hypothetical protein
MDSKERRSSDAPLKLKVDPFMLGGLRPLRHPWPDQNPADAFNEAHASALSPHPSRASGFVLWRTGDETVPKTMSPIRQAVSVLDELLTVFASRIPIAKTAAQLSAELAHTCRHFARYCRARSAEQICWFELALHLNTVLRMARFTSTNTLEDNSTLSAVPRLAA